MCRDIVFYHPIYARNLTIYLEFIMQFPYIREKTYALLTSRVCRIDFYLPIFALNQPYFSAKCILFAYSLKAFQALIYKLSQPYHVYYSFILYIVRTLCAHFYILFAYHNAHCSSPKKTSCV